MTERRNKIPDIQPPVPTGDIVHHNQVTEVVSGLGFREAMAKAQEAHDRGEFEPLDLSILQHANHEPKPQI